MQCDSHFSLKKPQTVQGLGRKKRCRPDSETLNAVQKRPRQSGRLQDNCSESQSTTSQRRNLSTGQLPSPALTGTSQEALASTCRKRKAKSLDWSWRSKRTRPLSEPVHAPLGIGQWLAQLPPSDEYDPLENPEAADFNKMSQPPSKRSRSTESFGGGLSQSGEGTDTSFSRDRKYSVYQDGNYRVVLETKGSYMRPFKLGMIDADHRLCEKLLSNVQPLPEDILFDDEHFAAFHSNLRGRSEARICADLHPRIMPSVENLCICGRENLAGIIEGHNDPWVKSIPFYGPRPQPDHTFGFKWFNFTEQQRRKLNIEPTKKSYYAAREDIYFPFLTGEVKCGKQGLDLADRPNAHSMTIALRGVVDLYRRLDRADEVHRRLLGLSISHDDRVARLYAHYPVIDGEKTTYWRHELLEINFGKGEERWQCYRFTLNVCELFALPFLERLKSVIDELPDPATQSFGLTTTLQGISVQSSQDDPSATDGEGFKRPAPPVRGLNAELRNMIQGLQRQLEQQKQDAERQRQDAERHTEQQRQDAKEREALLITQLEQQRKESEQRRKESEQQRKESEQQRKESEQQRKELEQQRKESEQQQKELMQMLKQQSEQIQLLLQRRP